MAEWMHRKAGLRHPLHETLKFRTARVGGDRFAPQIESRAGAILD